MLDAMMHVDIRSPNGPMGHGSVGRGPNKTYLKLGVISARHIGTVLLYPPASVRLLVLGG